ncbi:apelin receptor-like [Anolis sagrei]|uniref:apelin receptor-like n=1 Tax=Anolis sagrei TaxID=38937 RepID=UPI00295AA5C4|nr:apelin receptor-like [Anolis sagrei ordinatus]
MEHPSELGELYYYYEEEEASGGNWSSLPGHPEPCAWEVEEAETDWEVSFALLPALYLLVFVLGLTGNGLVLLTVWRGPAGKRRSADTYLGHLALADLAFVVTLPLWAAYTALRFHWPFGTALCKLSSYLVLLNMFASAFCLGCLSFERYLAIVHALPRSAGRGGVGTGSSSSRPRLGTLLSLGGVWLMAGLLALPALLLRDTRLSRRRYDDGHSFDGNASVGTVVVVECDMDFSALASSPEEEGYWLAGLSLATTALGFAAPLLLMTLCYCGIGAAVRRHFRPRAPRQRDEGRQRRRLLRILVALVAVFAGCWLPFHLLKSLYVLAWVGILELPCPGRALILRLHPYATCLAYLNSCLNPFLYAFFDGRFRAQCRRLLGLRQARRRGGSGSGAGQAAGSISSTLSGQTQKSEAPSLGTKV